MPRRTIWLADDTGDDVFQEAYPSKGKGVAKSSLNRPVRDEVELGRVVSRGNEQGLWVQLSRARMRSQDMIGVLDIGPRRNSKGSSSDDKRVLAKSGAEIGLSIYTAQLRNTGNSPRRARKRDSDTAASGGSR